MNLLRHGAESAVTAPLIDSLRLQALPCVTNRWTLRQKEAPVRCPNWPRIGYVSEKVTIISFTAYFYTPLRKYTVWACKCLSRRVFITNQKGWPLHSIVVSFNFSHSGKLVVEFERTLEQSPKELPQEEAAGDGSSLWDDVSVSDTPARSGFPEVPAAVTVATEGTQKGCPRAFYRSKGQYFGRKVTPLRSSWRHMLASSLLNRYSSSSRHRMSWPRCPVQHCRASPTGPRCARWTRGNSRKSRWSSPWFLRWGLIPVSASSEGEEQERHTERWSFS